MPRPCKCRRIRGEPPANAFKPVGVPGRSLDTIELGLDELEAIRLADLEGLYQDAAAEQMGVSRPTFGRLVERARHKIASALIQSKMLVFRGGPVMTREPRHFECEDCGKTCDVPHGTDRPEECPSCQGHTLRRSHSEHGNGQCNRRGGGHRRGRCRRVNRERSAESKQDKENTK